MLLQYRLSHRAMQCLGPHRSPRATCTPAPSWFPSSGENGKHIPVSMSWGFRLPYESNLQCFTSTLCYLWPAGAVADEKLGHAGASSCPDLLGLMVPPHWDTGRSRMQLCAQMSSLWSELLHQGFDWMTGSELLTDPLSPTSSVSSEISSCRCCADSRGPLSGYFS